MKVGILGGTFDPIHLGHLEMGRAAKWQKQLDEVWFMPSKIPPHKLGKRITEEMTRYQMVELAVEKEEGFFASDFELQGSSITYTAETLKRLKNCYPEKEFFFLMGGDSLFYLEQWYHPEKILEYAAILAFCRHGISKEQMEERAFWLMQQFGGTIEVLSMQSMEISSSMIREKLQRGEDVSEFLPGSVWAFLRQHLVYAESMRQGVSR